MTDERLEQLLRAALPPASAEGPSRNLWPLIADRIEAPVAWSWLDMGVALVSAIALIMFPKGLLLLVYHL
jgi:hypothetical protein